MVSAKGEEAWPLTLGGIYSPVDLKCTQPRSEMRPGPKYKALFSAKSCPCRDFRTELLFISIDRTSASSPSERQLNHAGKTPKAGNSTIWTFSIALIAMS